LKKEGWGGLKLLILFEKDPTVKWGFYNCGIYFKYRSRLNSDKKSFSFKLRI
jgi:hypothetical protein